MKQYYIKTFGCQMNVYDSQRIAAILQTLGYQETSTPRDADLVIFNTCHIREKAAEKVFSDLGRLNLIREERLTAGKDMIIGVVGCVVQAEDEQIAKRAPFVDFATGPLTYHRLPEILERIRRQKGQTIIDTEFPAEAKFDFLPQNNSAGPCAFLAIQEGCDNFCTYCVVPYTGEPNIRARLKTFCRRLVLWPAKAAWKSICSAKTSILTMAKIKTEKNATWLTCCTAFPKSTAKAPALHHILSRRHDRRADCLPPRPPQTDALSAPAGTGRFRYRAESHEPPAHVSRLLAHC